MRRHAVVPGTPGLGRRGMELGAGAAILARGQPVAALNVYDTHDDSTKVGRGVTFDRKQQPPFRAHS